MQPEEARGGSPRSASPRRTRRRSSATSTTPSGAASAATATRGSRGSRRSPTSTRPRVPGREQVTQCYERWDGRGALGYLTLAAIVEAQLAEPPEHARVVAASNCFPTGMLGHYVRRLAEGGLVAVLTATSPARLAHPDGGEPLAGTNPLAIGIPSSDGQPVVVDVSPAKATWGDVLAGDARRGGRRPVRRRAGAQGVRARARPPAPRRLARRGLRRGARRRAARGRPGARATRRRRRAPAPR